MAIRVLIIGWELPPHISGGLGVACSGLAGGLSAHGLGVVFVLPRKMPVLASRMRVVFAKPSAQRADTSLERQIFSPYETTSRGSGDNRGNDTFLNDFFSQVFDYAQSMQEIIENEVFDIIHAHDWLTFPAAIQAHQISGKPLVVHIHATEFDRGGGHGVNDWVYNIEKRGMEEAHQVITVSEYTKGTVVHQYGIDEKKISVVHNGIDTRVGTFQEPKERSFAQWRDQGYQFVMYLGRITLQKGVEYFVRAAARVLTYQPKTIFIIVGGGDMLGQVMEEAAALGISDKVLFTGWLSHTRGLFMYTQVDLFVSPSVSEPFGITALEALKYEVPVIISKQSGVKEVLPNSFKVDFWDIHELANKIVGILRHPVLKKSLTHFGRRDMMQCTWERAAQKTLKVYKRVLDT